MGQPVETKCASHLSTRYRALAEVWLIFLIFFIHAGWPVPDVNEPHYLGKAKHYWNPDWCRGDFFLESADAHQVFYFAFGWVTLWLPLPAVAWLGRVVVWGLLAWSWRRLSNALVDGWLYSVLSAALFVTMLARFHMAGEWVVGGIEAKGFAYVFVLLGIESLVRDRWGRAIVLFGAASAFHVIVGGWAVLATGVSWLTARHGPPLRSLLLPTTAGAVLAIGGLWPGFELTFGVDHEVVTEANRLYVYERLGHHLLPQQFPSWFIARHLLLVMALVPLVRVAPQTACFERLSGLLAAAVGIAAVGMLLSVSAWWFPEAAASLLRFYWFRTSDVLVPLGVALLGTAILFQWQQARHPWYAAALTVALLATGLHLSQTTTYRLRYLAPRADWSLPGVDLDEWREIADWAAINTPADARFLVPRGSQTFRWYAGRPEVVTRKDLPQDARSFVEWWERMCDVYSAETPLPPDSLAPLGAARLADLGARYGASYVVTRPDRLLALPRVGPLTRSIAIYQLPLPAAEPIIPAPPE